MKIFAIIYAVGAVLAVVGITICAYEAVRVFRAKHPDFNPPKQNLAQKFVAILRVALMALVPIVNLAIGVYFIFTTDETVARVVSQLEVVFELK